MQNKNVRVAVTTDGEMVSAHFGQCPQFTIYEIESNKIKDKKVFANTAEHGGGGCVAVDEILKYKIEHVIAGGMGMGAQQKFYNAGVTVHGYSGKVDEAIQAFISGKLGGLDSCREHGDCH